MAEGDGNGWADCAQGHRHWGRHGAAGLLACAPGPDGRPSVLLILRADWTQHAGTWGPPGGARDSHESAAHAALREAAEECAVPPGAARIHGLLDDDHGGWSYHTLVAGADRAFGVQAVSPEAPQVAWVPVDQVGSLPLHPGFAVTWPVIRDAVEPVTIIVDAANVMGSRADGWWRDRAGAAARLQRELAGLAARGVTALPPGVQAGALDRWFPEYILVLEGQAKAALPELADSDGVRVVAAPRSGDDTIAELAGTVRGPRVVVTADRELRRRSEAAGATVTGPRWLLDRL
ncbi:MAG TPA: NUDIX domain-containing protein [Streptosporangiaceae bacterium]